MNVEIQLAGRGGGLAGRGGSPSPSGDKNERSLAAQAPTDAPGNTPPETSSRSAWTESRSRLRAKTATADTSATKESWRPESGSELFGRYTATEKRRTANSPSERVVTITTESDLQVGVWLFYKVLAEAWNEAAPVLGELVLLERLKDGIAKGHGGAYRRYRVTVDRPAEKADPRQTDWIADGGAS